MSVDSCRDNIKDIMASKKEHVLLIDDDPVMLRLFGAKFASSGFEVLYATDGEEGRKIAGRLFPDIVLLDVRMPGDDGFTIARKLKTEPRTKDIPVVFLTNEDFSVAAEKGAKELFVDDYIHKSIDLNELVKRVKQIIRSSKESNKKG